MSHPRGLQHGAPTSDRAKDLADRKLRDADDLALFQRYHQNPSNELRNEIVLRFTGIAEAMARRFVGRGEPLDDLVQVGTFALIKAVDRFDPDRGIPFAGFAVPTILGELKRHFRDRTWSGSVRRSVKELLVRIRSTSEELEAVSGRAVTPDELAEHLGVSTEEILEALEAGQWYRADSLSSMGNAGSGSTGRTAEDLIGPADDDPIDDAVDRVLLTSLLHRLEPREQRILVLRFFEELSQDQIAEQLGISQMHVSRLLRRSLEQLANVARAAPPPTS